MISPKYKSKEGWYNHLTYMMDEESHEESQLFSVVVCNETDRFHVEVPVLADDHREEELPLLVLEALHDGMLAHSVQDHRFQYNSSTFKYLHIKFFCEYLLVQSCLLRGIKSYKFLLCIQNKRQRLELVLQMHLHPDIFCFFIQDPITKIDEDKVRLIVFFFVALT